MTNAALSDHTNSGSTTGTIQWFLFCLIMAAVCIVRVDGVAMFVMVVIVFLLRKDETRNYLGRNMMAWLGLAIIIV